MLEMSREGKEGVSRRGRLGIVLYASPSTSLFRLGIELAKAALDGGYDVEAFAWGDAVNATTKSSLSAADTADNPAAELAGLLRQHREGMSKFTLHLCTSCYKTRGLSQEDAIPGAHLGGLHNTVEMFQTCDRTLVMVP